MGLGGSIALIAIGLILAFAVDVNIAGLDERLIGLILAGAGVLGLVLYLVVWAPRRRSAMSSRVRREGALAPLPPRGGYVEERRVYDDPV
jgi:hypothetical protein